MDLVDYIKDQLPSELIDRVGALIGAGEGVTRTAIDAAVPALLSALSGVASSTSGTQKLASALGNFGGVSMASLADKLASQPGSLLEQGTGLLNSLLGSGTISGIVDALSRFVSIAPGPAQKLLGYLTPMVLGAIAGRFAGKPVTTQALSSLFAEQKANIASALPSGWAPGEAPGSYAAGPTIRTGPRKIEAAGPSPMRWVLPLLAVGALGLLLWWMIPTTTTTVPTAIPKPSTTPAPTPTPTPAPAPVVEEAARAPVVEEAARPPLVEATQLSTDLTDTFKSLTDLLTGVKDGPSAEAALPKLRDLVPRLDTAKDRLGKLTEAGKSTVTAMVRTSQAKLKELVDQVLAIPGVGDKIRTVVDTIMAKISDLAA